MEMKKKVMAQLWVSVLLYHVPFPSNQNGMGIRVRGWVGRLHRAVARGSRRICSGQ